MLIFLVKKSPTWVVVTLICMFSSVSLCFHLWWSCPPRGAGRLGSTHSNPNSDECPSHLWLGGGRCSRWDEREPRWSLHSLDLQPGCPVSSLPPLTLPQDTPDGVVECTGGFILGKGKNWGWLMKTIGGNENRNSWQLDFPFAGTRLGSAELESLQMYKRRAVLPRVFNHLIRAALKARYCRQAAPRNRCISENPRVVGSCK